MWRRNPPCVSVSHIKRQPDVDTWYNPALQELQVTLGGTWYSACIRQCQQRRGERRPTAVKQRSTSSFPLPSVLSSSPAVGGRTGIEIAQQSGRDITRFVDIATWWLSLASHASLRCSLAKDTFPHHRRQSDHSSGGHRTSN